MSQIDHTNATIGPARLFWENGEDVSLKTYERKVSASEQIFHFGQALLMTASIVPVVILGWDRIEAAWHTALFGIHQKTSTVALPYFSSNGKNAPPLSAKLPYFSKVSREEVMALESKIQQVNAQPSKPFDLKHLDTKYFPTDTVTYDGITLYCSPFFELNPTHKGMVALVQLENGAVYPRIFYESNSQGIWRCMPNITGHPDYVMCHYGKGKQESDTHIPIVLSIALHKRHAEQRSRFEKLTIIPKLVKEKASQLVSKAIDYSQLTRGQKKLFKAALLPPNHCVDCLSKIVKDAGAHEQTHFDAVQLEFFFEPTCERDSLEGAPDEQSLPQILDPSSIALPPEPLQPDFSACAEYSLDVQEYGAVQAKVFASQDRSLRYLFIETNDGKAFLAHVEKITNNPINRYGVREYSLKMLHGDAPLLEYPIQIPSQCAARPNHYKYNSTYYHSNWNYVRELKIIQLYYEMQKRPIPPALPLKG